MPVPQPVCPVPGQWNGDGSAYLRGLLLGWNELTFRKCLEQCLVHGQCHLNVYPRHLDFIAYFMVIQITGEKNFQLFFFPLSLYPPSTLSSWFFASCCLSRNLVSLQFLTSSAIITCHLLIWGHIHVFEYGYKPRPALWRIGCSVVLALLPFSLLSWERVRERYWFMHIYFNFLSWKTSNIA